MAIKAFGNIGSVLNKLATHPCGNLRRVAERFLSKSRYHRAAKGLVCMRTIHIPHVRQGIRVRLCMESKFLSSESRITKIVHAEFVPGLITVCLRGLDRPGVVRAMVHEMRHAQQLEILGRSKFCQRPPPKGGGLGDPANGQPPNVSVD